MSAGASKWAERAAELYQPAYARKYRDHDTELDEAGSHETFARWLRNVCASFDGDIDVLDLGCGTGRYFWCIERARRLIGIDVSGAMLAEARHPVASERITARSITLVEGDFVTYPFEPAQFDLVYSIGVLAEHSPLDEQIVNAVHRWLRPGGRFAFTTVHVDSPSIPRTVWRRLAETVLPMTAGSVRRRLRTRLMSGGLYADEETIRGLVAPAFQIESLTRQWSEVHLHSLCVARKIAS